MSGNVSIRHDNSSCGALVAVSCCFGRGVHTKIRTCSYYETGYEWSSYFLVWASKKVILVAVGGVYPKAEHFAALNNVFLQFYLKNTM
jgi:hypothetical protein